MIGIVDQPIRNALLWDKAPPVRWIEAFDRKRYLADPFPWPGSADTLLCETYRTDSRVGSLVVLKLKDGAIADEMPVSLPLDGHLSFPTVFMADGQLYLMPESSAARRLQIFRWQQDDGGKWLPQALVFADKPVADAVLFRKDDLFWIAYTDVTDDPHDNLNLVYAATMQGPWLAHPHNPVQTGKTNCRGAGAVFEVEGKLYRPAQDCSQVYGGALKIMEIVTCTPALYEEREVTRIAPVDPLWPDGFHTLNAWGDCCVVDGMRLTLSLGLLWHKIARRIGLKENA
jgi:hypothetical protein